MTPHEHMKKLLKKAHTEEERFEALLDVAVKHLPAGKWKKKDIELVRELSALAGHPWPEEVARGGRND